MAPNVLIKKIKLKSRFRNYLIIFYAKKTMGSTKTFYVHENFIKLPLIARQ